MRVIKPKAEIMSFSDTDDLAALRHLEAVGRICYKSEDRITDDSCINFVSGIIKRGHEAVIEHYSLIFALNDASWESLRFLIGNLSNEGFHSFLRMTYCARPVVSGNIRAWRDFLKWIRDLHLYIPGYMRDMISAYPLLFPEYQELGCSNEIGESFAFIPLGNSDLNGEVEMLTHIDITARLTNDRGVSHEEVRHRVASFAQESTRYCNYAKDKFGSAISYIDLAGSMEFDGTVKNLTAKEKNAIYDEWVLACEDAERHYFKILELGATPQIARSVLNNSTKTEICITMNLAEWKHFFELRCSPAAHPAMREVAYMLLDRFAEELPDYYELMEVSR